MSQPRKKRIVVYELRITCYTDFVQNFLESIFEQTVRAMRQFEVGKKRITEIELQKRVLDGKTFAEIKQ